MWIIVIALLLIGLVLILIELVFIPGTTVVGLLGLAFSIVGIVVCYQHLGEKTGLYVLIGMSCVTLAGLFYSFRSGVWSRFSLKSSIDSRVNEGLLASVHVGDEGIALSSLRPMGKAEFHEKAFEVKTSGGYVVSGERVKITQIELHQIVVEPVIKL
ncbi:MAG TPA: NfeD family protein [Chryseolinea sp.]|nr:NfeD family protein [Chryseolinea sp.]